MTLHVPGNKDAGSFSKTWQNYFYQITLQVQRLMDQLSENFIGTENDINSKRAFLDKAREWFDVLVGTTGRLTLTRKLGQRIIELVPEHSDIIGAGRVFEALRPAPVPRLVAGSNITLTNKLGSITIDASGSSPTTFWEPVTNGDPDFPEVMFDGAGDILMNEVPL